MDGWEAKFAFHTVAALILGVGGVAVHRGAAAMVGRRVMLPRGGVPAAVLGCAGLTIAGFWYLHTRPPDLDNLRVPGRLYYLGKSFEGLRLTRAEPGSRHTLFVYGGCDTRIGFDPGGCSPPLQLQNVTCQSERTAVAIFGGGRGLAGRAAKALRPVQADPPLQEPRVFFDTGARCAR